MIKAFKMKLYAGMAKEYEKRHNELWPEMKDMIHEYGVNKSLFKVRVLDTILKRNKNEIYSFFIGVVLCDEIKSIINQNVSSVIIGGNESIREAMGKLLGKYSDKDIVVLSDKKVNESTVFGAIRIYEKYVS